MHIDTMLIGVYISAHNDTIRQTVGLIIKLHIDTMFVRLLLKSVKIS